MSTNLLRIIGAGAFIVLIFLTGFGLSLGGKPYNGLLFNLHKFFGLGALVSLILTASQVHKMAPLGTLEMAAVALTAVLFVATIIAGGLASINTPLPEAFKGLHKVFPALTTLASVATLYLLLFRK